MKRFTPAPDSFRGTLAAAEVCNIICLALPRHIPNAKIHALPMADGGERMVDAMYSSCSLL